MKKLLSILTALAFVIVMTACNGGSDDAAQAAEQAVSDDGQNPVMNYIGNYVCDRATVTILAKGDSEASVVVDWGNSYDSTTQWTMSGPFNSDELTIEYHDCEKVVYQYAENGDELNREEVFTGGHGFIKFIEGDPLSLTWQEDQEHAADDMTFTFVN